MKRIRCFSMILLFSVHLSAAAQETTSSDASSDDTLSNIKKLVEYLYNLGGYLGYDLEQAAATSENPPSQQLLNSPAAQLAQNYAINSMLGAYPVNASSANLANFVPTNFDPYAVINYFANYTFNSQPYNASGQGKVSVNNLLDQQTYQNEPVNQAILNILGTPDYTYCMNYDATAWDSDCKLLNQNQVSSNIVGKVPQVSEYFTYNYIQPFLPQLNSNTLISPLLYAQDATESTSSSPSTSSEQGLVAQNQAQAAENFIRYATGAVTPLSLPKKADYNALYSKAFNLAGNVSVVDQKDAQGTLVRYFASLRAYAAQTSVAYSNLYYILSKRLPQNQSTSGNNITSQAMSEFTMATRRLFDPAQDSKKQWVTQINNASAATVQKEVAILLSEINYQLYLNRQQEERLLLTNSILLLQGSNNVKPSTPSATTKVDEE